MENTLKEYKRIWRIRLEYFAVNGEYAKREPISASFRPNSNKSVIPNHVIGKDHMGKKTISRYYPFKYRVLVQPSSAHKWTNIPPPALQQKNTECLTCQVWAPFINSSKLFGFVLSFPWPGGWPQGFWVSWWAARSGWRGSSRGWSHWPAAGSRSQSCRGHQRELASLLY